MPVPRALAACPDFVGGAHPVITVASCSTVGRHVQVGHHCSTTPSGMIRRARPVAASSTSAPDESSAAGAKPAARSASSTSRSGAGDTRTVGARAQRHRVGLLAAGPRPSSPGRRSARTTRRRRRAACRAVARRLPPDTSGACGTGVFEWLCSSATISAPVSGVECPAHTVFGDAVHRRRARRLELGDERDLRASSAVIGPGTMSVRSAWARK